MRSLIHIMIKWTIAWAQVSESRAQSLRSFKLKGLAGKRQLVDQKHKDFVSITVIRVDLHQTLLYTSATPDSAPLTLTLPFSPVLIHYTPRWPYHHISPNSLTFPTNLSFAILRYSYPCAPPLLHDLPSLRVRILHFLIKK